MIFHPRQHTYYRVSYIYRELGEQQRGQQHHKNPPVPPLAARSIPAAAASASLSIRRSSSSLSVVVAKAPQRYTLMPLGNVGVVFADAVTLRVVVAAAAADAVLRKLPLFASSAQSNRVESSLPSSSRTPQSHCLNFYWCFSLSVIPFSKHSTNDEDDDDDYGMMMNLHKSEWY